MRRARLGCRTWLTTEVTAHDRRDRERRRSGLLLGGPLGRGLLAGVAGIDGLRLLAAAGEPVPDGVAFFTASSGPGDRTDGSDWPPEWAADERDASEMIAAAVAGVALSAGQPWHGDQAELLRQVAAVAEGWAFGGRHDAGQMLAENAELLRPVAEAVAGAPSAAWWWQPADRETQRWLGCEHHPELARGDAVGRAARLATDAESVGDDALPWPAPEGEIYGGTWWSGPIGDTVWTTRGEVAGLPAVGLACAEDPFGPERFEVWQVQVDPAAKIYEVHGPEDWGWLAASYPRDVTVSRRHDWYRWTGHEGPWILPDWPAVARRWDGVHVSVGGYLSTAGMRVEADGAATLLAGWYADQTLWLHDVFTSVRHIASWEGTPGPEALEPGDP